jgi:hypothetical protein
MLWQKMSIYVKKMSYIWMLGAGYRMLDVGFWVLYTGNLNNCTGGCPFLWSALVMSPLWLGLLEPFILSKPIGHDKVPMFFWSPLNGPGAEKEKKGYFATRQLGSLRYATINFSFLKWPWSWWVPGSRSVDDLHQNVWKQGIRQQKGFSSELDLNLQNKWHHFLRWRGVFSWKEPFNGWHNYRLNHLN